jgi:hypothetical protein
VRLSLPASGAARLEVVDALGRVVATPLDGVRASGEGAVEIDLAGLAPGVYRLVLRSGGVRATQRLVVVR